jgi:ATP-binding cassette subfamily A (ABC1) protein 3
MVPFIIYAITAINQSFFFASLFNESKIAGEVYTFFSVAATFFIFTTFVPSAAE